MPKASNNGFAMFMYDYRKREERNGRKFHGLDEVVPFAGAEWCKMTPEQKSFYKEKARDYKTSEECRSKNREIRNKPAKPKPVAAKVKSCTSSTDESLADNNEAFFYDKDNDDKLFRRREQDRNALKNALSWNLGVNIEKRLLNESFFVISVQNYYETPEHDYQPAEIAFVEFSLTKGILKQFNAILKPINVPSGWMNLASSKASQTHQISPFDPPKDARDDYRKIVDEIKRFYVEKQPSNQFRAFTLTIQFNSIQGAVKALRDRTNSKLFIPQEKISCVEDLFSILCGFKGKSASRNDLLEFRQVLKQSVYDYEPNTLCPYHLKCNSKHCALSVARKVCYHLFDRVKDVYGLTLTPDHIPKLSDDVKFNLPKFDEKVLDETPDEQYARLVAPDLPPPPARYGGNRAPPISAATGNIIPNPTPAPVRMIDRPQRLHFPGTLPSSLCSLPGFDGLSSKWRQDSDNLANEAVAATAESVSTVRKKPKEPKIPTGLSSVKWETVPVFSTERKKFVDPWELRPNSGVVRPSSVGYAQVPRAGFSTYDNTRDNVLDDDDDWEAANFATSSPFENRSRHSSSPISSIDVDFQAVSNRLNSLGLNQFSPPQQFQPKSSYSLTTAGGAVARSMRLPFCKPNANFLQAPTSREENY